MKGKKKRLRLWWLCIAAVMMLCFGMTSSVFAANATLQLTFPHGQTEAKWKVLDINRNHHTDYNVKTLNGTKVYCVELGTAAHTGLTYISAGDMTAVNINASQEKELGYISALGYGYKGDTSDEMDWATQIRAWQAMGEKLGEIDASIQSKIDGINSRLGIMKKTVSFDGKKVQLNGYGKEYAVTLNDTTGVFQHYIQNSASGIHMEKKGNSLKIWAEKGDKSSGTLKFDCLYGQNAKATPIAYKSDEGGVHYQNLSTLGKSAPKQMSVSYALSTGSITLDKQDYETGTAGQGFAKLDKAKWTVTRTDTDAKVGEITWNNGTANTVSGLPVKDTAGNWITYHIKEIEAPTGYYLGYWDQGTFKNDFEITFKDVAENSAHVRLFSTVYKDTATKVDLSKVEIAGGPELPGATLELIDQNGNSLETWVSGDTPHRITGLEREKIYTLRETIPASGHYSATDIEFTISGNYEVEKVEMVDKPTQAYITKTDITGDKELEGAKLEVRDKETNKVIDKWTSDKKPHLIEGKLDVNKTYILKEKAAPKGYEIANSIEFKIADDGQPVHVTMKDKAEKGQPQTGDNFNGMLYVLIIIAVLAAVVMTGATIYKRKTRR